ncbi:unnamed protein product [Hymenolepis diminuta]|uniref:Uncharacterized protein n=1 Tax=Hymenolepis diminuta TaxID=6216 RepID=A0A564ZDZ3_HYMDI|nr:unnamed protein product [Hymenolepis diminuta]
MARFPQIGTSFVCKVREEVGNETNQDEVVDTRKRREYCQRSCDSIAHSIRRPEFVRRADGMA